VVDAHGTPLAVLVSAANVHDSKMMLATVDAIEPIRAKTRGRPRRRPHKLHADKGYDYRHLRLALRKRRIIPRIARCGVEPKNRLGRYRWVVERTLSWLNRFRRLKIRYEHRADIHLAFLQLGSLAAPSSPCVSSANHVQLARTVGLDRRARPLLY
jgi:transposase